MYVALYIIFENNLLGPCVAPVNMYGENVTPVWYRQRINSKECAGIVVKEYALCDVRRGSKHGYFSQSKANVH